MKTQIIALEAHDDFISVRDRMSWAKSRRILLVWPKFEKITLRAADLRILQQHAFYLGAEMGVITRRGDVRRDAEQFGIPVFASAAAAQRQAWPRYRPMRPLFPGRSRRERSELESMRAESKPAEAGWTERPLARIGFFALGVLAVLAIAALFVPHADITLTPESQQQAITLPVTASKSIETISIAGSVPAHEISIIVDGTQSARVATRSNIPDKKARGIARFTNLSQSDVTIPAGTILYSLSPAAVQFATLNNTHIPGNVNAVVEVPIAAVSGGAAGNLPANAIQAIQGNLSLSASVTNPEPTTGGTDRLSAAPSEADRQRLHEALTDLLNKRAQEEISASLGAKDLLLGDTLKMGEITEETYDPPAGQAGELLKLTLSAEFRAEYVKADDLTELAETTLNSSKPAGFAPMAESLAVEVAKAPSVDDEGASHFELTISRKLVREVNLGHASALIRGRSPEAAGEILRSSLPLAGPPEISLRPGWWPWMPLIPFRVSVTSER